MAVDAKSAAHRRQFAATMKDCSACGASKDREAFSKKQWNARAVRRCLTCIAEGATVGLEAATARLRVDDEAKTAAAPAPSRRKTRAAPVVSKRLTKLRRRRCDVCQQQGPLSEPSFPICDGCGLRRYCGVECQRNDWLTGHKHSCGHQCDKCGGSNLEKCPEAGCGERVCMSCEPWRIATCGHCEKRACENCSEARFCEICKQHFCMECMDAGKCDWVTPCHTCYGEFCGKCRDASFCDACGNLYCEDCRLVMFCDDCGNPYCEDCRYVGWCSDCSLPFCEECRDVDHCVECGESFCKKCRGSSECDFCYEMLCAKCARLHKCARRSRS